MLKKCLNDFIKNDALRQQEMNLNITQLAICDGEIIGFVSILTDTLKIKTIEDKNLKEEMKNELNVVGEDNTLPAIKIGRFAIDERYTHKGLGSEILMSVLFNVKNIAENDVGLRFVTVEGYASAYTFYTNHNFISLKKDDENIKEKLDIIIERNPEQTFYLYLDLRVLE